MVSFSSVIGTIVLVFYTFPYLGIIFVPLTLLYFLVSSYYRRSSVETKRLDSVMRSILYGSFAGVIILIFLVCVNLLFYRNADWSGNNKSVPKSSESTHSCAIAKILKLY